MMCYPWSVTVDTERSEEKQSERRESETTSWAEQHLTRNGTSVPSMIFFKDSAHVGCTHRTNHKDERERGRWSATSAFQTWTPIDRLTSLFFSRKRSNERCEIEIVSCLSPWKTCPWLLSFSLTLNGRYQQERRRRIITLRECRGMTQRLLWGDEDTKEFPHCRVSRESSTIDFL